MVQVNAPQRRLALWRHLGIALLGSAVVTGGCRTAGTSTESSARPVYVGVDDTVHVVTFGDSNTDFGWSGTSPIFRARSYISDSPPRPEATDTSSQFTVAGKIERRWRAASAIPIRVVNHGISGTTTGGGGGLHDRNRGGAPNMRTVVGGFTRFDGEVLGLGYPWSGGEPVNKNFPTGPIRRVNAFTPGPLDFAYVSMGTNDLANDGIPPTETIANLTWMVNRWISAGHAADHLVMTTLPPRMDHDLGDAIPTINDAIRILAKRTGVGLIDLADFTSADNGRTWRSAALHIGDRLHYSEPVRDWIAAKMVAYMDARVAARSSVRRTTSPTLRRSSSVSYAVSSANQR